MFTGSAVPGSMDHAAFPGSGVLRQAIYVAQVITGQQGALHIVRHLRGESSEAKNDRQLQQFLQEMVDLGLVEFVGRWQSWSEILYRQRELPGQ